MRTLTLEDGTTIQEGLNTVTGKSEKLQPAPSNLHPNLGRITRSSGMPYHPEQVSILQKVLRTKDDQGTSQPYSDQVINLAMTNEHDILKHIIRM